MVLLAFAGLALTACAGGSSALVSTATLAAADAATSLAVGEAITQHTATTPGSEGGDDLVLLTLQHADGRTLRFQQANHTPHDVMAQSAGGPLAQIMGLFGEEAPTLYYKVDGGQGAPFLCGAEGPAGLGLYRAEDGAIRLVGLKQRIVFETRHDGVEEALPYSPDQVCARLRFNAQ